MNSIDIKSNEAPPWMRAGAILLALMVIVIPTSAQALQRGQFTRSAPNVQDQDSSASPPITWSMELSGRYLHLQSGQAPWSRQSVMIQGEHRSGTYRAGLERAHRFGTTELQFVGEAYPKLWDGAYGHLRISGAHPGRTAANFDGLARLYQTIAQWEPTLGGRVISYPGQHTLLVGLGTGRYGAGWYGTVRFQLVRSQDRSGWGVQGLLRWYLSGEEVFLDIRGHRGTEIVVIGSGPDTRLLHATGLSLALRNPLLKGVALRTELRYTHLPETSRWGGSAGLHISL